MLFNCDIIVNLYTIVLQQITSYHFISTFNRETADPLTLGIFPVKSRNFYLHIRATNGGN